MRAFAEKGIRPTNSCSDHKIIQNFKSKALRTLFWETRMILKEMSSYKVKGVLMLTHWFLQKHAAYYLLL